MKFLNEIIKRELQTTGMTSNDQFQFVMHPTTFAWLCEAYFMNYTVKSFNHVDIKTLFECDADVIYLIPKKIGESVENDLHQYLEQ